MPFFVKRLTANELGHTRGHQRGGILIPKDCVDFFPPLGRGANPETQLAVSFGNTEVPLRLVYYIQGSRDEYRLTPIPHGILRNAAVGDYLVIERLDNGRFSGEVIPAGSSRYTAIERVMGGRPGRVFRFLPP